jgi:hypothetical protein
MKKIKIKFGEISLLTKVLSEQSQAGQMLLEVILALGVVVIVMGAIANIVVSSLSSAQYARNQSLANSYAQEGLNVLRRIRDSSWTEFSNYITGTKYCIKSDLTLSSTGAANCTGSLAVGPDGIFSREVVFGNIGSVDCDAGRKVSEIVSWTDGKCPSGTSYCNKVKLVTCFLNIDLVPAP